MDTRNKWVLLRLLTIQIKDLFVFGDKIYQELKFTTILLQITHKK